MATHLVLFACALGTSSLACELVLRRFAPARDVGPSFTRYDPVYGKRLKEGASLRRVTPEFTMRLTTNSLGFRGPEPEGPLRGAVVFLGDSFTLGYGVDDGEEFSELLRRALVAQGRSVPVVNAGLGDSGNGRWLKFLHRDASRFEPRLVVLQVQETDFDDNPREGFFSLSVEDELIEQPVAPESLARRAQGWIEALPGLSHSHLIGRFRQLLLLYASATAGGDAQGGHTSAESEVVDPLTRRLLEESLALCGEQGWPVLGVLADVRGARRAAVEGIFASRGVPLVVVASKLERPDLYYRIDGHWNAAGHAEAARLVLDALEEHGWLRR